MVTYRGHIRDGQIALDEPVAFPEGAEVIVAVVVESDRAGTDLSSLLLRHAGQGQELPSDLAEHHDYYAHGKPKR
ncbi:MAG: hypothetical protein IT425_14365 [Pirellulales bacterium]|nr:hypothetical protein [Pirellulales bacterium]